jgi:hypothetical protein
MNIICKIQILNGKKHFHFFLEKFFPLVKNTVSPNPVITSTIYIHKVPRLRMTGNVYHFQHHLHGEAY